MTTESVNVALEQNQNQKARSYLGPSAWKSCDRAMWFNLRGVSGVILHDANTLRTFEVGHLLEDAMCEWLEKAGATVMMREAEIKNRWGGVFGHIDGIVFYNDEFYLLEMKTAKEQRFKEMVKKGIPDYYYSQIQIYMANSTQLSESGRKLEKCLYFIFNKNTSEIDINVIPADPAYGEIQTERMHDIIASDALPPAEESYKCNMCDHSQVCKGDTPAEISCMTCAAVSAKDGGFECSLGHDLKLCDQHVFHPQLMELMGYQIESVDSSNLAIDYGKFVMAPENYHKEGKPTFTSTEFIGALSSGFLDDEFGMCIKAEFAGRVSFNDKEPQF